ncbi:MAG: Holliday junction ATP-dependent DNA helicase RuvA [Candidatus Binatia bacterium]|nr:MAG: Holliday junction ATP-dependent DNA helicase RuvA [Candidatus Binatia bacterium]
MIAWLAGRLVSKSPAQCIVDVHGVGYQVFLSLPGYCALPEVGAPVQLHIHTHVREDALHLYGFLDVEERDLFLELLNVSGVGPRLALTILSGSSLDELREALVRGDTERLVAIPGVGKKTAARLVVELRDRLAQAVHEAPKPRPSGALSSVEEEAVSALVNFGFKPAVAQQAVRQARSAGNEALEDLIRDALRRAAA